MKYRTRKLASLLLALTLVVSLATSAFAAAYICPECHTYVNNSFGYCTNCGTFGEYYPDYDYGYDYNYCYYCNTLLNSNGYCYNPLCSHYNEYRPGYDYGYGYNYCYYCNTLLNSNGYCYNPLCSHYNEYRPGYDYGYGYNYCYYCDEPLSYNGYCRNPLCSHYNEYRPGYDYDYNYNYCYYCNTLLNSNGYCNNPLCSHYNEYRPGYDYDYNYNYCYYCNTLLNSDGYCRNPLCSHYNEYRPGYEYGYNYCYYCNTLLNSNGYCNNPLCSHYNEYRPGYEYGYNYCYYCNEQLSYNGYCRNPYCTHYNEYRPGYGYETITPILYAASLGESVDLNSDDFHTFWSNYTNGLGTLKSVTINSVSGLSGTLCYDHSSGETRHQSALNSTFYVSPTGTQKSLSSLTFVPNKSGNSYPSGSVTISFTASGTSQYGNNANRTTSTKGTLTISFTKTDVSPISYTAFSNLVSLNSSDFDAVYRAATGSSSTNATYSVKFLDLPEYGTLYHGYSANILLPVANGIELTPYNISSLSFTNRNTGTYTINNVTYVAMDGSYREDSARYAVYSGNTLLYVGTITFKPQEIIINYGCTSSGVNFSSNDFLSTNSAMYSQYIIFGQPTSGTLYKDYANKVTVTSNDHFSYASYTGYSLDNVVYVPASGYTGVVEFPFYGSNINGTSVSGTVRIYVVAKAFEDVNPSSWSATYINRLYASGIIGGTSATTFSPKAEMNYGAALKMILLAAGYPKQSETGGTHWASNYLDLAYRNGIVSSANIDLNASVDRNTIAEIAAKALGMKPATSINAGVIAPNDSTNGYVYALYNAGIVSGTYADGKNFYNGNEYISREEIAKIVCNIMDYDK